MLRPTLGSSYNPRIKQRLEFSDGTSHKFWQVEVQGPMMTVVYGRIGADGQTKVKTYSSPAEALKAAAKLVAEKEKKGYAAIGLALDAGSASDG